MSVSEIAIDPTRSLCRTDIQKIIDEYTESHGPGASSLPFAGGAALDARSRALRTVAVIMLGCAERTSEAVYSALSRLEWATQSLRIGLITDTRALKSIRPFGWMVEHVMSPEVYSRVEAVELWPDYARERLRSALALLDAEHVIVIGPDGFGRPEHHALNVALGSSIPFELLRP